MNRGKTVPRSEKYIEHLGHFRTLHNRCRLKELVHGLARSFFSLLLQITLTTLGGITSWKRIRSMRERVDKGVIRIFLFFIWSKIQVPPLLRIPNVAREKRKAIHFYSHFLTYIFLFIFVLVHVFFLHMPIPFTWSYFFIYLH